MSNGFIPTPSFLPPLPKGVERCDGQPNGNKITNQIIGCAMLARPGGTTHTELKRCCEAHYDYYTAKKMPLTTAKQTLNKIHRHWRWEESKEKCKAVRTGHKRDGEDVYELK